MQLGFVCHDPKPVQAQRYHMVLQFIGGYIAAQAMMQEAIMGTWLNNSNHPHFIDWGSLRTDLDFLEENISNNSVCAQLIVYVEV